MYNFDFEKPSTIADAVAAMATEDAQALGGGQTLIPTMKQRLASPAKLVSLKGIAEMQGVCVGDDGAICVGGATSHADVAAQATGYPALSALAGGIGDPAVRARGTVGGSLANNDPAACYPAGALGSGATIVTNSREIAADDYFQGMFTTALDEGEIVTEVRFPVPEVANYQKFEQGVRVAVTGASEEGVFRWSAAEEALSANFSADAVPDAPGADGMISDLHGTAAYRAHLVAVLTRRAVAAAG